jgi:hypothetical protein
MREGAQAGKLLTMERFEHRSRRLSGIADGARRAAGEHRLARQLQAWQHCLAAWDPETLELTRDVEAPDGTCELLLSGVDLDHVLVEA